MVMLVSFSQAHAGSGYDPRKAKEDWSRDQYNRISGSAETLERSQDGHVIVGVHIEQKTEDADNFCRATTPVYPGAQPTHACYSAILDGDEARSAYESSAKPPINVLFSIDGHTRVGGAWNEKIAQDPASGIQVLCVKTHAVVPNPIPTYKCFNELVPLGGGASIGN
jgi:hypothetical protein